MISARAQPKLLPDQSFQIIFQDPDWPIKTGIGGFFNALSLVLLSINPAFLPISFCLWAMVNGYVLSFVSTELLTCAKSTKLPAESVPDNALGMKKVESVCKLPEWKNWLELMISGLTWAAAGMVFFIGTVLIFPAGIMLSVSINTSQSNLAGATGFILVTWCLFMLIAPVISLFSSYLMVNFAQEQNIAYAFLLRPVLTRLKHRPLLLIQAWLIHLGLQFLAVLLPLLTVIGVFLIPSTLFLAQAIGGHLLARVWRLASVE
jgi:hypothetical protein